MQGGSGGRSKEQGAGEEQEIDSRRQWQGREERNLLQLQMTLNNYYVMRTTNYDTILHKIFKI